MEQKTVLHQTQKNYPAISQKEETLANARRYAQQTWKIWTPLRQAYYAVTDKITSINNSSNEVAKSAEFQRYTLIQNQLSLLIELLEENSSYAAKNSGELSFLAAISRVSSQILQPENEALAQITRAAQIPLKGVKTTKLYNLVDFLKESFDIPNIGPDRKHVVVVVLKWVIPLLLIFLGLGFLLTAASFLWPLAVAGAGLFLLMFTIEKINNLICKLLPFEVVDYNPEEYLEYQQAVLNCFEVELQLPKDNKDPKRQERSSTAVPPQKPIENRDSSYTSIPLPIRKTKKAGVTVIDADNVPQHQQSYTAVRVFSIIKTRLECCQPEKNSLSASSITQSTLIDKFTILTQKLDILTRGKEDNSYLEYEARKENAEELTQLNEVVTHLFPDVPNICTITWNNDNPLGTLTISHEKTVELINAEDFSPEKFLEAIKKDDNKIPTPI